jgi:DNA-binding NarL/FixJ family response regulator
MTSAHDLREQSNTPLEAGNIGTSSSTGEAPSSMRQRSVTTTTRWISQYGWTVFRLATGIPDDVSIGRYRASMFTILIVEDDELLRKAFHDALRAHFRFPMLAEAKGVVEAVAMIDSVRPDVLFLDIRLADGDGLELSRRLRAAGFDSTIAFYTWEDAPEFRAAAIRSGANHFLVKGLSSLSDIFGVVESTLASRFRVLIMSEDATFNDRTSTFLSTTSPDTLIVLASNKDEALQTALTLRPHLVVLQSEASAEQEREFRNELHNLCDYELSVVSVRDAAVWRRQECPTDYCVSMGDECAQELNTIVNSLRDSRSAGVKPPSSK